MGDDFGKFTRRERARLRSHVRALDHITRTLELFARGDRFGRNYLQHEIYSLREAARTLSVEARKSNSPAVDELRLANRWIARRNKWWRRIPRRAVRFVLRGVDRLFGRSSQIVHVPSYIEMYPEDDA